MGQKGMNCKRCKGKTKVSNTYLREDGSVQRRHQCLGCGHKFKSREYDESRFKEIRQAVLDICREDVNKVLDSIDVKL